jgi:hypothetical protein
MAGDGKRGLRGRLPPPHFYRLNRSLPGRYIATIDGEDWIVSRVRWLQRSETWSYELDRRANPREVEAWG